MNIIIAGDFCPNDRVSNLLDSGKYDDVLGEVKSIIEESDYSIVNFECPITTGIEKPIKKSGPNLQCRESGAKALRYIGFKCVTLANNHLLDYGEDGVKNSLSTFEKLHIDIVGGGININDASRVLYKEIEGESIAIINCCEHEFSIATKDAAGANPLNPIEQYHAIKKAKTLSDYVIVIVHGGHEHFQGPTSRMIETYRFFVEVGADAVINHHQHCYSGYEEYMGKPIFYGIGNFCFDNNNKRQSPWNYGYMVKLLLKSKIDFEIYPYIQCSEEPKIKLLERNSFEKELGTLNSLICDDNKREILVRNYYESCKLGLKVGLFPASSRAIRSLLFRRIIPISLPKKWLLRIENYMMCESHRDKMVFFFKNFNK